MIRVPAVQAHLLVRALAAADLVLPERAVLAEIGEQLVRQVHLASGQVAQQVSQYKDGLRLLHRQVQQVLVVHQQQVKN
jgi:hypothetical protein